MHPLCSISVNKTVFIYISIFTEDCIFSSTTNLPFTNFTLVFTITVTCVSLQLSYMYKCICSKVVTKHWKQLMYNGIELSCCNRNAPERLVRMLPEGVKNVRQWKLRTAACRTSVNKVSEKQIKMITTYLSTKVKQ